MILHKEVFSEKMGGMLWICSNCDNYHLKYGNVTMTLTKDFIHDLYIKSFDPMGDCNLCHECGGIHFSYEYATLNMAIDDYKNLLKAIHRFYYLRRSATKLDPVYQANRVSVN